MPGIIEKIHLKICLFENVLPIIFRNILLPGELTCELTETCADCIFEPWILWVQRNRKLSIAMLLNS